VTVNRGASAATPRLAVIVVVYNMRREAPRTLYSLSAAYQNNVEAKDYEVVVVENGSSEPLSPEEVTEFGENFRYFRMENAPPSPARAINFGVESTTAPHVGIMIDGARIASPGILYLALAALERFERPIVVTVACHLGPDLQSRSIKKGYDRLVEDRMLAAADWQNNGYKLFEVSAFGGSSEFGWFGPLAESSCMAMHRSMFCELRGFDERFDYPGGGFLNLDFFKRACELPGTTLLSLFGEGTFHQMHGGALTNLDIEHRAKELRRYEQQYRLIRGRSFELTLRSPLLFGTYRRELNQTLDKAIAKASTPQ
jgi:glycosyltransferase involved in cell wall biosynthesis